MALRNDAHAICEKPIVLNPWNIDALQLIEKETNKKIFTILQLRLHPAIIELKEKIANGPKDKIYDIDLTYITSRGHWYFISWKGDQSKSGGVATNIGVHFFDMLQWIFGDVKENIVHVSDHEKAAGYLVLEKARVRWFLGINFDYIPKEVKLSGKRTFRSISVDGEKFEFSDGFTDLHTLVYKEIIAGKGFGLTDSRPSIETVYNIRNSSPIGLKGEYHPLCKEI
jgi:UDP-N-acetyl-2-amino-2-deoxyglucuronate dehydrogenase